MAQKNPPKYLKPKQDESKLDKIKYLLTMDLVSGAPPKMNIPDLQITFLGAAETVTGSKYLVEYKKIKFLVDCGLFQGLKDLRDKNRERLPVHPKNLDFVLLTHAHLDHSGYIPLLVKEGFRGKVYCTEATKELCRVLLPDSGFLQEEDAAYAKKKQYSKHSNPKPLYTEQDALKSLKSLSTVEFGKNVKINEDVTVQYNRAGHILGAATISVNIAGKTIVFSGDLGRENDVIVRNVEPVPKADYVLVESTYGNRDHGHENPEDELEDIINRTVKRGGKIIVPAFAVGRAQKILYYIMRLKKANRIPDLPIFLDSPMSIKVTHMLDDFIGETTLTREECYDIYEGTRFAVTQQQSKRIFEYNFPCMIISASGMATGGRVLHHIAHYAPDPNNTILFTGFQAEGTRGRSMVDGAKEIKIHGKMVPVKAEVLNLNNVSAHGDRNEIINWLRGFQKSPDTTFVIHGEPEAAKAMSEKIEGDLGWRTIIPDYLQTEKL